MRMDLTDITFLLDRSGSMSSMKRDVVGGVEAFIAQQKEAEGEANFTLVQFDTRDSQEVVHNAIPIGDVPDAFDFTPRGGTPLLDATGLAIVRTGERLRVMKEEDRPGKVVFVVFTDGYENSSVEYSRQAVRDMINHQSDNYNWQFMFLGAGVDTFADVGSPAVALRSSAVASRTKVSDAVTAASVKLASYRSTSDVASLNYSDSERAELLKGE